MGGMLNNTVGPALPDVVQVVQGEGAFESFDLAVERNTPLPSDRPKGNARDRVSTASFEEEYTHQEPAPSPLP